MHRHKTNGSRLRQPRDGLTRQSHSGGYGPLGPGRGGPPGRCKFAISGLATFSGDISGVVEDVGVSLLDVGVLGFFICSLVLSEGVEWAEEDSEWVAVRLFLIWRLRQVRYRLVRDRVLFIHFLLDLLHHRPPTSMYRTSVCPAFRPRRMKTEKRRPDLRCWNHRSLSPRVPLCPVHGLVLFHVLCHVPSTFALCLVLCVPGHLGCQKKEPKWMPTLSAYQGHHERMR